MEKRLRADAILVLCSMTLEEYLEKQAPKLSHAEFGERVGVTQAAISRYLNGTRFPSPELIRKIQSATNDVVTANDLLVGFEKAKSKKQARENAA
jgi:transcriptional regulator with XRE-family HTH domain